MIASTLVLISFFGANTANPKGAEVAVQLDGIHEAWTRRSEAFAAGNLEWDYVSQPFGRFESYWLCSAAGHESSRKGKLSFTRNAVRYESESTEYPALASTSYRFPTERDYFRTHLLSHFQDKQCDRRNVLMYSMVASPSEIVHLWEPPAGVESEYPRAIVAPAGSLSSIGYLADASGFVGDSNSNLSGVPSPVLHQIGCLPVVLALRPGLFDVRLADIADHEPELSVTALPSGLIEVSLPSRSEPIDSLEWRIWVDPEQDFSVRRIFAWNVDHVLIQCDVRQEEVNHQWLPAEWTVQILDTDPSFARQVAKAKRSAFTLDTEEAGDESITPSFAVGTWFNDLTSGQHRIITEQGSWEFPASLATWQSYEQLLAQSRGEELDSASSTIQRSLIRRILSAITKWPGLAIPLSVLGAGMLLAVRIFAPRASAPESSSDLEDLEAKT